MKNVLEILISLVVLSFLLLVSFFIFYDLYNKLKDNVLKSNLHEFYRYLNYYYHLNWFYPKVSNKITYKNNVIFYHWYSDEISTYKGFFYQVDYRLDKIKVWVKLSMDYYTLWFYFPLILWKKLWIELYSTWKITFIWDLIYNVDWYYFADNLYILSQKNWSFTPPICPENYIPVNWNKKYFQPWFCIAKYEMTYLDKSHPIWNIWEKSANTYWPENPSCFKSLWCSWKYNIWSKEWFPIASITQKSAIDLCLSLWTWFHLVTNLEWLTVAEEISSIEQNWSWGIIWTNLYNWVSNNSYFWIRQLYSWRYVLPSFIYNKRRVHFLRNWIIWDFAWNVREHVNKANTLNWDFYNYWNWNENEYKFFLFSKWTQRHWVWSIYWSGWKILLRWWDAASWSWAWIYAANLSWDENYYSVLVWFRCSYVQKN